MMLDEKRRTVRRCRCLRCFFNVGRKIKCLIGIDSGPLFFNKATGVLFRDIRVRSSHFSRNSLICSLDRKKCLLRAQTFLFVSNVFPSRSSFFAYHIAKFARMSGERYARVLLAFKGERRARIRTLPSTPEESARRWTREDNDRGVLFLFLSQSAKYHRFNRDIHVDEIV